MKATVLSFDRRRGYGFAVPDDLTADVFVHRSNLPADHRYANEGDRIEYDIDQRNGRPVAVNIRIIGHTITRKVSPGDRS
jgi:cold shock CspA family protein